MAKKKPPKFNNKMELNLWVRANGTKAVDKVSVKKERERIRKGNK